MSPGHGITFLKSDNVVALTHKNRECQVVLGSGKRVPTDFVVAGIGVTPSMELFQRTALDTSDGIKVNKFLETSISGVWAAGDIANYPDQIFHRRMRVEHWDNAVEQGHIQPFTATLILGIPPRRPPPSHITLSWVDDYHTLPNVRPASHPIRAHPMSETLMPLRKG